MNRSNYMLVPMLTAGVLLLWGLAMSSEGIHAQEQGMATATLSLEEAIATAKTKFPGQVLETELENEHGQAVYEIEIASTTGVVTEIKVDAQSGELLSSDIEGQDDTEEEKSEEKDTD
ncbi:MAG: PepSY domain-containing protein [Nitrospirota bacterium]|nr:PepSY domain-containing protein [Nitrospirota bacterium]